MPRVAAVAPSTQGGLFKAWPERLQHLSYLILLVTREGGASQAQLEGSPPLDGGWEHSRSACGMGGVQVASWEIVSPITPPTRFALGEAVFPGRVALPLGGDKDLPGCTSEVSGRCVLGA